MARLPLDIPDRLRADGLHVVEVEGWPVSTSAPFLSMVWVTA